MNQLQTEIPIYRYDMYKSRIADIASHVEGDFYGMTSYFNLRSNWIACEEDIKFPRNTEEGRKKGYILLFDYLYRTQNRTSIDFRFTN